MAALPRFAARLGPKLCCLLLVVTVGATIAGPANSQPAAAAHSWAPAAVPALQWKPCADPGQAGFDCATARVPLDYSRPRGATIELALIRHKATDQAHRIGTLFFNPGGPGGSGVVVLPLYLKLPTTPAAVMFPVRVRERFDIISWDPRGVGASTSVQCFATPQKEAKRISKLAVGVPYTLRQQKAWMKGWADIAERCARSKSAYLLPHVSTTETARDLDLLRRAVGDEKLTYQGNSYGTLLGAVYANLFPDKVRAMVLLGNDEPVGYTNSGKDDPRLDVSLRQHVDRGTAKTLNAFLKLCGQASRQQCAFSAGSGAATKAKWASLLEKLRTSPITAGEVKYDYDLVVTLTVISLYEVSPGFIGVDWESLGNLLEALWEGSTDPTQYPPLPNPGDSGQCNSLPYFAPKPQTRVIPPLISRLPSWPQDVPALSAHTGSGVMRSAPPGPLPQPISTKVRGTNQPPTRFCSSTTLMTRPPCIGRRSRWPRSWPTRSCSRSRATGMRTPRSRAPVLTVT